MKNQPNNSKSAGYNDLPSDVLGLIFGFLGNKNSQLSTRLLNKQAKIIIDGLLKLDSNELAKLTSNPLFHLEKHLTDFLKVLKEFSEKVSLSKLVTKLSTVIKKDSNTNNSTLQTVITLIETMLKDESIDLQKLIDETNNILNQENKKLIKDNEIITVLSKYIKLFTDYQNTITKQFNDGILARVESSNYHKRKLDITFLINFYLQLTKIDFTDYYSHDSDFLKIFVAVAATDEGVALKLKQFVNLHYEKAIAHIPKLIEALNTGRINDEKLHEIFHVRRYGKGILVNEEAKLLGDYKDLGIVHFKQLTELEEFSSALKQIGIAPNFAGFKQAFDTARATPIVIPALRIP